jgi:tartrate dehydratase beta subunit/fumarate hydratase class I family protein
MPNIKMRSTFADADRILYAGRIYQADAALLKLLDGARDPEGNPLDKQHKVYELIKVVPKGIKVHRIEPVDPMDEERLSRGGSGDSVAVPESTSG